MTLLPKTHKYWLFICLIILNLSAPPWGTALAQEPTDATTEPAAIEPAPLEATSEAPSINNSQTPLEQKEEESTGELEDAYSIFDDHMLLEGYAKKYAEEPLEVILAMLRDDTLNAYRMAAAVRIFREKFMDELFYRQKRIEEKTLLRRLGRTDSIFVEIEIMHTLCDMDRYRYFDSMVPALIQKMEHYNRVANELAFDSINDIIKTGHNRAREARILFNTLRKTLFLSRQRLEKVKVPDDRLKQKLQLLRWSIKVLGNQELKRLPKAVINLL